MACPVKLFVFFVLNCLLSLYGSVSGNNASEIESFGAEVNTSHNLPFLIKEREEKLMSFTLRNYRGEVFRIVPVSDNIDIADVRANMTDTLEPFSSMNFTAKVKGNFLGRVVMKLFINTTPVTEEDMYDLANSEGKESGMEWYELPEKYDITVSRDESALSHSFTGIIIILVCLANVAMGCKTELAVVKEVLQKPIGPLTGMFSQFVLMPLIALGVIFAFEFDPANALGFFALSCAPGGAASNAYSYLLAGDVSLSVTMTLCSTLLSLGMIPLWLFTVGSKMLYHTTLEIPYMSICTSLIGLLIPVAIGMLLQWRKPNWAKYVVKAIRPFMIIFFIFIFTVGVYANLYIFTLMRNKPEILLAGALVPYMGFVFGGLTAIVTRQSWRNIRTIAIETGIQNTGIAIVLLKVSLPPPDNDISIVAPIAAAIFTPIPMVAAIIGYEIYKRCYKKKHVAYLDDHEGESENEIVKDTTEHHYVELKENNNVHVGI
ncbi:ileal sodium/bile acid cotransporter-like [Dreissena polymorpha]|uniref:Ileal sodium/bile acid cotransporter n=1 Tax=Dreissena polymorpha TaxID=45954 RepID=A0A9D4EJ13_DREPO|nr:ileal sodium/bile acid cotransporter-like [Dreissena polymorpha]KAH3778892.1 hypothetical protein DPMN_180369 [Dreissena polymorpha]